MEANVIEGNPTKKFFIEMITRDISIEDAIIDLLDNSIDGANRLRGNDFNGLTININIDNTSFCIEDNCGGFSLEVAQNMHLDLEDQMKHQKRLIRLVDLE